jgi:predicted dehydrogenase
MHSEFLDIWGAGLTLRLVEPLGIGLIGIGRWGRNYVRTLYGLTECGLVAMADSNPAVLAAAPSPPGVRKAASAAQLLSDPSVEAVVIATPDATHYSLASAALEAGRDVLVEKPMTLSADEAETLARQAGDAKRILAVGHTAVYSTDIESLRTRLEALPKATAHKVTAERTSSGPSVNRQSSIIFDLCPHDIAIGVLLFGTPAAARARAHGKGVEYEVRFGDDELLAGRAEWRVPPHVRRFEVASTDAPAGDGNGRLVSGHVRDTPLGRQCLDFIQSCRTRRQPLSNGELGVAVVRCLAALDLSCADNGAWVRLQEEVPMTSAGCRGPEPASSPIEAGVRA